MCVSKHRCTISEAIYGIGLFKCIDIGTGELGLFLDFVIDLGVVLAKYELSNVTKYRLICSNALYPNQIQSRGGLEVVILFWF
jgi:hypothetical protein